MSLPDTPFAAPFAMMAAPPLFPSGAVSAGLVHAPVALGVVRG